MSQYSSYRTSDPLYSSGGPGDRGAARVKQFDLPVNLLQSVVSQSLIAGCHSGAGGGGLVTLDLAYDKI